jgi:hypothetical protein
VNSVFDGLDEVFTETLGEPVIYTRLSAPDAPLAINAIWIDYPIEIQLENANVDSCRTELSVRASDVASPKEGDTVKRVSDNKTMTISTPIQPDGKGMIVCNLTK